jgi:hypothetical protein
MQLYHANRQWATRPDDEKFNDLQTMRDACFGYAQSAVEAKVIINDLRVSSEGDNDMRLVGRTGVAGRMTHHAFGQLCQRAKAPAGYLRSLPSTLAVQNLNHGLKVAPGVANLMAHRNGELLIRSLTTDLYQRVWNWEVCERLMALADREKLVPARPTFRSLGSDAPALYASDHDMFAFLMSSERQIRGPLGELLLRGVIAINSEVGEAALKFLSFYFRDMCGNHIIWGAREVAEVKLVHVGQIRERFTEAMVRVRKYMDSPGSIDEAQFQQMTAQIATTKDEVLDAVFGKLGGVSRKELSASYDAVREDEDGAPNTKWGLAQGITRYSQQTPYADERTALDRAAGKLLQIEF